MTVVMLRHAATQHNLHNRYIGKGDPPLCPQGLEQARSVVPDPWVRTVYTSSLRRTQETAAILFPRAELHPCTGLDEMDFGEFEGKSWLDMAYNDDYRAWVDSDCRLPCPGGEDREGFTRRSVDAFLDIVQAEQQAGAECAYFVVHGGTMMAVLSRLAYPAHSYFDWNAGFCGGYRALYQPQLGPRPLKVIQAIRPHTAGRRGVPPLTAQDKEV